MLIYTHPAMQLLALGLGLWALILAWPRFVTIHLGRKRVFLRRRHILLGEICLMGLILGMLGGLILVRLYAGRWLAFPGHAYGGLLIAPFALFGLASGLYLVRSPRQRKVLPLLHGLGNLAVVGLSIYQIWTGHLVLERIAG